MRGKVIIFGVDLDVKMSKLTVLARVRLRSAFVLHLLQSSVFTVGALTVGEGRGWGVTCKSPGGGHS